MPAADPLALPTRVRPLRRPWSATCLLAIGLLAPLAARAEPTQDAASIGAACTAADVIAFRGFTTRLENDLFVDTDHNYTNGVAFMAVSRDIAGRLRSECLPAPVRLHAELINSELAGHQVAPGPPRVPAAADRAVRYVNHIANRPPDHPFGAGISATTGGHDTGNGLLVGLDAG